MKNNTLLYSLLLIPFTLTPAAFADDEDHDDHNHHNHEAHVHGAWELFSAMDENELSLVLKGPLVDLVGFEHKPKSDEEKEALHSLHARLSSLSSLVTVDEKARCSEAKPAKIEIPHFADHATHEKHDDHDEHEDHDHHNHEGDETHAHHSTHDHEKHEASAHTDNVEVHYSLKCASPKQLKMIEVTAFTNFPQITTVEAVYLSDQGQAANKLTPRSPKLKTP